MHPMLLGQDYDQCCFNVNLFSVERDLHQDRFFSQLTDFIHCAKLNKTTTMSLLSLLRTTNALSTDIIPKSANGLWEQLGVKFGFESFYFCSICLRELRNYQDICSVCDSKEKANCELCVFSLKEELERVVKSTIDVIQWYRIPQNQIVADVINGKSTYMHFEEKYGIRLLFPGDWYRKSKTCENRLSLMISTDGKPMIKSKRTRTSVWPVNHFNLI